MVVSMPTLDQVVANPGVVERLPMHVCGALVMQAASALAALGSRVGSMALEVHAAPPPPASEQLIGPKALGAMFNVSASTVREKVKAREHPYIDFLVPTGTKKLTFSKTAAERFIQRRR